MSELEKLREQNKALTEVLQHLVDTKERKDKVGKDEIYLSMKEEGWLRAKQLLKSN